LLHELTSTAQLTHLPFPTHSIAFMAAQISTSSNDPVRQFSVFAENRVGRLYDLTALLKDNNVHVMALNVLDNTDSAIFRFIVDDPDKARELMINNDFPYTECKVLAVEIVDESELKGVLAALFEAEINIHYVYSFIKRPEGKSGLAINAEDEDVASQALNKRGYRVLTQRDISR
jgi:hypothetical protein